ncbi:hypothetical protein PVAP13_3NG194552 [Panicum virgatum]|uniref:FBD domain-containing protein n=1 Tax=Panicum virgatum TaxID=38727 RepID=A0A8T0U811_PANVG|nr:hypothetical protein PVAP13_3NG194552 [Panicum virgatum]
MVPSVFALLLRCPRLRLLDIVLIAPDRSSSSRRRCFCDELLPWTDHREISLGSLEVVRVSGFTEADEDVDLVRLLFASSDAIRSMILSSRDKEKFRGTVSLKRMMTEDDDATGTLQQKLMNNPSADRGRWHFGDSVYTWTGNAAASRLQLAPVPSDAVPSMPV